MQSLSDNRSISYRVKLMQHARRIYVKQHLRQVSHCNVKILPVFCVHIISIATKFCVVFLTSCTLISVSTPSALMPVPLIAENIVVSFQILNFLVSDFYFHVYRGEITHMHYN